MSDSLLAFVSDNGHVIGIGVTKRGAMEPKEGIAVAVLEDKVTIVEWLEALNGSVDLLQAVKRMVHRYGGEPIAKPIDMDKAAFVSLMGSEVGEA